jgi:hypothetical protein
MRFDPLQPAWESSLGKRSVVSTATVAWPGGATFSLSALSRAVRLLAPGDF